MFDLLGFKGVKSVEPSEEGVLVHEVGQLGTPEWTRAEYVPRNNQFAVRRPAPYAENLSIVSNIYDSRSGTNQHCSPSSPEDRVIAVRAALELGVHDQIREASTYGYSPVGTIVSSILNCSPLSQLNDIRNGVPYLYTEIFNSGEIAASLFMPDGSVRIDEGYSTNDVTFGLRQLVPDTGNTEILYIDNQKNWRPRFLLIPPILKQDKRSGVIVTDYDSFDRKSRRVHRLSRQQFEALMQFRPTNIYNPLYSSVHPIDTAIYTAVSALQFTRWSEYQGVGDFVHNPNINPHAYTSAIHTLFRRFEAIKVQDILQKIIDMDFQSLDGNVFLGKSPYKPHSDIKALDDKNMRYASELIMDNHPLHHNMFDYGEIVNAKPLFGEEHFWRYLRARQPKVFKALTSHILAKGEVQSGSIYTDMRIDPIGIMRDHFPEAYAFVSSVFSEFKGFTPPGKAVVSIQGKPSLRY